MPITKAKCTKITLKTPQIRLDITHNRIAKVKKDQEWEPPTIISISEHLQTRTEIMMRENKVELHKETTETSLKSLKKFRCKKSMCLSIKHEDKTLFIVRSNSIICQSLVDKMTCLKILQGTIWWWSTRKEDRLMSWRMRHFSTNSGWRENTNITKMMAKKITWMSWRGRWMKRRRRRKDFGCAKGWKI